MEPENKLFERRNKMDENSIKELLSEEIAEEIQALSTLEAGSKEKSTAIDDLTKLYKLRIEESKSEWEADEKYNRRVMEDEANTRDDELKQTQIAEQVKDRYFRLGIAAAELMIPLMFLHFHHNLTVFIIFAKLHAYKKAP